MRVVDPERGGLLERGEPPGDHGFAHLGGSLAALDDEPDDEIVALFEGHSLDILELVRQAIELQAPIAPLCSPDCAGLPDTQQYFETPEDARWGALKNWTDESAPRNGSTQPVE